jgi:hypothetical protein
MFLDQILANYLLSVCICWITLFSVANNQTEVQLSIDMVYMGESSLFRGQTKWCCYYCASSYILFRLRSWDRWVYFFLIIFSNTITLTLQVSNVYMLFDCFPGRSSGCCHGMWFSSFGVNCCVLFCLSVN